MKTMENKPVNKKRRSLHGNPPGSSNSRKTPPGWSSTTNEPSTTSPTRSGLDTQPSAYGFVKNESTEAPLKDSPPTRYEN